MSYQLNTTLASRQIHCSSQHGLQLTSPTTAELYFEFAEMLADVPPSVDILLSVVSATIPYSWPNVSTTQFNNVFAYAVGESPLVPRIVTVPSGYYNVLELIAYLNASAPFTQDKLTAAYDRPTGLVTITRAYSSVVNVPSITYGGYTIPGWSVGATIPWVPLTYCSLGAVLGFDLSQFSAVDLVYYYFSTSSAVVWRGTSPVRLLTTQSVWVESDFITDSFDSRRGGRTSVLARVPVRGVPGTYLQYENITQHKVRIHQKQLGAQIMLRLTDDAMNLLNLRSYPWTVTLQLDFIHELDSPDQTREQLSQWQQVFDNNRRLG